METDTIRTGFSSIDMVTEGLKSSEVMVIAGREEQERPHLHYQ